MHFFQKNGYTVITSLKDREEKKHGFPEGQEIQRYTRYYY